MLANKLASTFVIHTAFVWPSLCFLKSGLFLFIFLITK